MGRVIGQTRKAFIDEGFALGDAKKYIDRVRAYYKKHDWTITDEVFRSDKNLQLWAKAKGTDRSLDQVNGVAKEKAVTGDLSSYRNKKQSWEKSYAT